MRIAGAFGSLRIHDVEFFLVGRETEAVGLIHLAGNDRRVMRLWIQPVNIGG